jgi:hypothetical protein
VARAQGLKVSFDEMDSKIGSERECCVFGRRAWLSDRVVKSGILMLEQRSGQLLLGNCGVIK